MMALMGFNPALGDTQRPAAAAINSRNYMREDGSLPWFYMPSIIGTNYTNLNQDQKLILRNSISIVQRIFGLEDTGAMNAETAKVCYLSMYASDDNWKSIPMQLRSFLEGMSLIGSNLSQMRATFATAGAPLPPNLQLKRGEQPNQKVIEIFGDVYSQKIPPISIEIHTDDDPTIDPDPDADQAPSVKPQPTAPKPVGVLPRLFTAAAIIGGVSIAYNLGRGTK